MRWVPIPAEVSFPLTPHFTIPPRLIFSFILAVCTLVQMPLVVA